MLNNSFVSVRSLIGIVAVTVAIGNSSSPTSARRSNTPPDASDSRAGRVLDAYARLPVAFVENRGQIDPRVRYYAQGPRYAFYLTRDEVILSFVNDPAAGGLALSLRFR